MRLIDDQPETIHLYVVKEEVKPSLFPIIISVLALFILAALCTLLPYQHPVMRTTIRVPAVPLYVKDFHVSVQIVPTGIKKCPATTAHGVLTITNGSIIGLSIPAGFTVQGVVTDTAVYVPPGNANGYGWAEVQAHAALSGSNGNYATYTINAVIGSSVYIRNLRAFRGGKDSYFVRVVTPHDKLTAFMTARTLLATETVGLHNPCQENQFVGTTNMVLTWHCQFVTYTAPSFLHITSAKLSGKEVLISGWFTEPIKRFWVK